jgi:hypothetical protein
VFCTRAVAYFRVKWAGRVLQCCNSNSTWAIQLIGGLLKPVDWTVNSDSWAFDGTDTVRTVYGT